MRLLRAHTASQAALWPERPYAPLFLYLFVILNRRYFHDIMIEI